MRYEITLKGPHLGASELEEEAREAWADMLNDPDVISELTNAGVNVNTLKSLPPTQVVTVRPEGAGLTGVEALTIVLTLVGSISSSVAANFLYDYLKTRTGEETLGKRIQNKKNG